MTELVCIVCPKGCHLFVDEQKDFAVTGQSCPRGEAYGREELISPIRTVTSTVRIEGALCRRCSVKTDRAIPKSLVFEAVRQLDGVLLHAPIREGQTVIAQVCGTDVCFVCTRDMEREDTYESVYSGLGSRDY
ncbi:DUF1667 domain-containing protein [Anaerotruncus sp. AF02-27]|uniref:DUF1667 domain-containing protein n=1 Tax=Anaerotruncus sp. AF02-27 TaxID=2292191 RepID=UPI000E4A9346|nr:DUF1667 domain-containing protein [Anaerotruncus sp. AF02-27]RGX56814.1 DUF1667 domain-containing protein [Anaerotruncus sp. AF02-27]